MDTKLLMGINKYIASTDLDKIAKYKIGIIGLGGLGSNVIMMLVRLGFRNFVIADKDVVDLSNLNRQNYNLADINKLKTMATIEKIKSLDPYIKITYYHECITQQNLEKYYKNVDIILECTDKGDTKQDIYEGLKKYLPNKYGIFASGVMGYGSYRHYIHQLSPHIYKVGIENAENINMPLAPRVNIVASLMADTVLKIVLGEKSLARKKHMDNFHNTPIYALTDRKSSQGKTNVEMAEILLKNGIKFLQYREKDLPMGEKFKEAKLIRNLTKKYDATFIVNDHIDLALLVGADGVHLGQEDIPPQMARNIIGKDMILGISTHNEKEYNEICKINEEAKKYKSLEVVDYIGVGPVYRTNTKVDVVDPVGFSYPRYAQMENKIPFVCIGGIKSHNIDKLLEIGIKNFAMVTELTSCNNLKQKIEEIKKKLY